MKVGPRIMLAAGEASGDLHGAALVTELKKMKVEVFGLGGPAMAAAGMRVDLDLTQRAVIGFINVLLNLRYFLGALKRAENLLRREKPDLLVIIDNPGFNLRLAEKARQMGVKVCGYISPQIWAWKAGRVKEMKRDLVKMLVTFPFEKQIYEAAGLPAEFMGNPLVDAVRPKMSKDAARKRLGARAKQKVVGLLPGSRKQEVIWLLPVMVEAARLLLKRDPQLRFAVLRAPGLDESVYAPALRSNLPLVMIDGAAEKDVYGLRRAFDVAMVSSGTATLETALLGTPLVLMYRVHSWEYLVGRMLVDLKYIGLPNVVAGRKIIPEFIQGAMKAQSVAATLWALLTVKSEANRQLFKLKQAMATLGKPGVARRCAVEIMKLVKGL